MLNSPDTTYFMYNSHLLVLLFDFGVSFVSQAALLLLLPDFGVTDFEALPVAVSHTSAICGIMYKWMERPIRTFPICVAS